MKAPVLFVSHGAPTFAIEPGALGPQLDLLGQRMTGLQAVLVISPHWQTSGIKVMTSSAPETLHDFAGFPAALYTLRYDVAGQPLLATRAAASLREAGFAVEVDDRRGLDHGAWVPLRYLLPEARLPVFQVSMPYDLDVHGAIRLGRALAPLRDSGVLIVASGSLTHNLHEFRTGASTEPGYAQKFARWIRKGIASRDIESLLAYRSKAPHAQRAHPTEDHFLPLLVALGASDETDNVVPIKGGMTYGVLSMDSFAWGIHRLPPARTTRRVDTPARLSESQIAAICQALELTSPLEQP
jgi:4,5-DOPA dioxygenase extradiol